MVYRHTLMNWNYLLNGVRLRDGKVKDRTKFNKYDLRNDFDDDYARIVFSSAFRRLQDKAQVFPLDSSDFVRTRLTHSLEVSTIGRSIGVSVEENLIKEGKLEEKHKGKISSLLAVTGLIHDLGNPPYGHFGEASIQKYFKNWFSENTKGQKAKEILGIKKVADFENFEGNAQSFRLVTKLNNLKDSFGYNLSAPTLATILKYPRSSVEGNKSKEERKKLGLGISYKKFGYLQSEEGKFNLVKKYTGIEQYRHPVTFLLEAADDIAYSAADLEDGCKKGVLDYQVIIDVLGEELKNGSEEEKAILNSFIKNFQRPEVSRQDKLDIAVQNLRIEAQGFMIKSVVKEFLWRHEKILNGEFDEEIIKVSDAANMREAFKKLADIIFNNREIVSREFAGGKVIHGLLEMFVKAVISDNRDNSSTEEGKLCLLISNNYKDIMKNYPYELINGEPSLYDRLQLVTDFVCGMTDTYALELYRKLTGIKL
ncbi:dGTP triphosphohydrolase [Bacillus litorisediminis]|uniref:dGTP triphosphohydrolase n=1 Tax=Bacillus litorisediminis TaxID=2922713 RepID=UPI001FAFE2E0|nr:dNTP triphosphohydrolase [Bacillus litorisediminis]